MKQETMLDIEWRPLEVAGKTGDRCAGTIASIRQVPEERRQERQLNGVRVRVRETTRKADRLAESKQILIKGILIEEIPFHRGGEDLLPVLRIAYRAIFVLPGVEHEGTVHEEIPGTAHQECDSQSPW
jgi:hypothetical protein